MAAKKPKNKKPRRGEGGEAETPKELYKDASQRARYAQSGGKGYFTTVKPYSNVSAKISPETRARIEGRAIRDAKSAPGRNAPPPRTGPNSGGGGQSARYNRLTGGGLNKHGR